MRKIIIKNRGAAFIIMFTLSAIFLSSCGNGKSYYDASGTFEATEVVVSSEASGRIIELNLKEGDLVKEGDVCGDVDSVQLVLKREQLKASIAAAKTKTQDVETQTGSIREQIATQTRERERVQKLIAADAASTKQLDDINASIAVLNKQLKAATLTLNQTNSAIEAEVATMCVQMEQINDQISRCRIVSPISGHVLAKYAEQGEITAAGKPLLKIADVDNMYLRAYITSGQLSDVKLGQEVVIYSDSGEKEVRVYIGNVVWISDKAEFTPKTIQTKDERANLVYAVKIAFENDGYVKIGMYGDVKFDSSK